MIAVISSAVAVAVVLAATGFGIGVTPDSAHYLAAVVRVTPADD